MTETIGAMVAHFASILAAIDFMQWLLLWFLLLIPIVLWRAHVAPGDGFDLRHLIAKRDGELWHLDAVKFMSFVAFVIASWVFLALTVAGRLTEWFFFGYMTLSFVGPAAAKALIERYSGRKVE